MCFVYCCDWFDRFFLSLNDSLSQIYIESATKLWVTPHQNDSEAHPKNVKYCLRQLKNIDTTPTYLRHKKPKKCRKVVIFETPLPKKNVVFLFEGWT